MEGWEGQGHECEGFGRHSMYDSPDKLRCVYRQNLLFFIIGVRS